MSWFACCAAFTLCFVSVPLIIALSWKIGAVDIPCDWRRMHCESIPRAGGLSIFFGFFVACFLLGGVSHFLACALGGGFLILLVGVADDIFCLDAWVKFFFQVAAATAAVLGSGIASGMGAVLAILWVLTLTNAHNFVDGLDGLFAGVSAVEGVALCLTLLTLGLTDAAMPPLLLALACLGFRVFNRYPAQIFAGDCGSGTVGFLLGFLSLPLFGKTGIGLSSLSPLLLFGYPLTDLAGAVLRRVLRGKSPFQADRAHLHHRICDAGLTHPQCGGVLILISAGLGGVGVLLSTERFLTAACLASVAVAFLLMRIRQFIVDCS